jgi:hypothetical protein
MAEHILEHDEMPIRFERFCADLFTKVDGRDYVTTSRTHDLGRDGRCTTLQSASEAPLICCSLRDDLEKKASDDLVRVLEHAAPQTVRLCFSKRVSELRAESIKSGVLAAHKGIRQAFVDGQTQLADLACRHAEVFSDHYAGEIAVLRDALLTDDASEERQITGMRIALTTQLQNDARTLREDITRNLVLTSLASGNTLDTLMIVKHVSDSLHLARVVRSSYVEETVDRLLASGHIRRSDRGFQITDIGRTELGARCDRGSRTLLEGRSRVRGTILELTGYVLEDAEFARLWKLLQNQLAGMFMYNGIHIVEAIASIMDQKTAVGDHPHLHACIGQLASQIESEAIGGSRSSEIAQAVRDMFNESQSYAFGWLSSLCSIYVGVCSLGLEPLSQEQVAARLREIDLVFDTDVIISFLSESEPQHRGIVNVVRTWRSLNGRVSVAESSLKEAASHAWISEAVYSDTWQMLGKISDADAFRLVENAFVRGFRAVAAGQFGRHQWNRYIQIFRGTHQEDYRKIQELLLEEGIQVLGEGSIDKEFAGSVTDVMLGLKARPEDSQVFSAEDQLIAEHDGHLVALLLARREQKRQAGGGSALIVSSAKTLRNACRRFADRLGEPEPVIPVGAIGYLLALVPGVTIELGTLAKVLFDPGLAEKVGDLERLAIRVIKASSQYSLAWSRRGALKREMRNCIAAQARQRGKDPKELEAELRGKSEKQREILAEVIAEAVDKLVPSKTERQAEELKKRIAELEGRA